MNSNPGDSPRRRPEGSVALALNCTPVRAAFPDWPSREACRSQAHFHPSLTSWWKKTLISTLTYPPPDPPPPPKKKKRKGEKDQMEKYLVSWFNPIGNAVFGGETVWGVGFSQLRRECLAKNWQLRVLLPWPQILLFSLKLIFLGLETITIQLSLDFKILSKSPLLLGIHFCLFRGLLGILKSWDADKKRSIFLLRVFHFLCRNN